MLNSSTQITAVAPAQAAGTVDITVTTPSGTSATSSADHFTYSAATAPSVTSVSPSSGLTTGGTTVTISGSHFTGATGVSFGGNAATSFTVLSDGSIVAVAPAGSAGTVDITVTTPSGTSSTGSADHFTYKTADVLTSVAGNNPSATHGSPWSGQVGSFTDTTTSATAASFLVLIDWGDGTQSVATVALTGYNGSGQPEFQVNGSHTYASAGTYTVTTTIFLLNGGVDLGSSTSTATVAMADPPDPGDDWDSDTPAPEALVAMVDAGPQADAPAAATVRLDWSDDDGDISWNIADRDQDACSAADMVFAAAAGESDWSGSLGWDDVTAAVREVVDEVFAAV